MKQLPIKRIYAAPAPEDGWRILVDRLWPRGVSKDRAAVDLWLKEIAPSPALRQWFGHRPERFTEFSARYQAELSQNPAVKELLSAVREHRSVTLLYAAKDERCNHAVVLQRFIAGLPS